MIENPKCYKCSGHAVKSGSVHGKQRWTCKICGLRFTRITAPGKPLHTKLDAICLYMKGLSLNAIAHLKGVSPPAVLKWVKQFALANYEKPIPSSVVVLELDEMWHFLESKKDHYGFGKSLIVTAEDSLTGKWETVMLGPCVNS